jgi:hypothetical protein
LMFNDELIKIKVTTESGTHNALDAFKIYFKELVSKCAYCTNARSQ